MSAQVKKWTPEEVEQLRALAADGLCDVEMGQIMGRSRDSVAAQRNKHRIFLTTARAEALSQRRPFDPRTGKMRGSKPVMPDYLPADKSAWNEMCRIGSRRLLRAMIEAGCIWRKAA